MPKIVDRDERRIEIARAYLAVVAEQGMHAASSRVVAARLNVATGSLWHYFTGFDEMVAEAFELVFERTDSRIRSSTRDRTGLAALFAAVAEILPLTKETGDEALVVSSFWGRVAAKPELAPHQIKAEEIWRAELARHTSDAVSEGTLRGDTPVVELTNALMVFCIGMQVEFVLHTDLAAPERQRALVEGQLRPWLAESTRPGDLATLWP